MAGSRKRFIGEITGVKEAKDRVMGSAAVSLYDDCGNDGLMCRLSAQAGAECFRVHDVKATKEMLDMYYGIFPL